MQLGDQVYYIVLNIDHNSWLPMPHIFNGFYIEWANIVSINKNVFLLEKPALFWFNVKRFTKNRSELFTSREEVFNKFFGKEK